MIYRIPELRSLSSQAAQGDSRSCVDGSQAQEVPECANGAGDFLGECFAGDGAATFCGPGTADIGGDCTLGNSPGTFCVSGGDDTGPP